MILRFCCPSGRLVSALQVESISNKTKSAAAAEIPPICIVLPPGNRALLPILRETSIRACEAVVVGGGACVLLEAQERIIRGNTADGQTDRTSEREREREETHHRQHSSRAAAAAIKLLEL